MTGRLRFTAIAKVAGPFIGACAAIVNDGKSYLGVSAVFNSKDSVEEW